MISQDFFDTWNDAYKITNQIADVMYDDKLDWKPHKDINPFGVLTANFIITFYHSFKNYLMRPVDYPDSIKIKTNILGADTNSLGINN